MAYVSVSDIRLLSGLTTDDVSDDNLSDILDYATAQLNADINYNKEDERVTYINNEKDNDIDGSNTTFYAREVHKSRKELGDFNNDGTVDEDDIEAYTIDAEGNRSSVTVSSVDDPKIGKFTLENAPASDDTLYITYSVAPLDESTPHKLVETACIQLTAAYAFTRIDSSKLGSFKIGKIRVGKQTEGFTKLYDGYKKTVRSINSRITTSDEANDPIEETTDDKLYR